MSSVHILPCPGSYFTRRVSDELIALMGDAAYTHLQVATEGAFGSYLRRNVALVIYFTDILIASEGGSVTEDQNNQNMLCTTGPSRHAFPQLGITILTASSPQRKRCPCDTL